MNSSGRVDRDACLPSDIIAILLYLLGQSGGDRRLLLRSPVAILRSPSTSRHRCVPGRPSRIAIVACEAPLLSRGTVGVLGLARIDGAQSFTVRSETSTQVNGCGVHRARSATPTMPSTPVEPGSTRVGSKAVRTLTPGITDAIVSSSAGADSGP